MYWHCDCWRVSDHHADQHDHCNDFGADQNHRCYVDDRARCFCLQHRDRPDSAKEAVAEQNKANTAAINTVGMEMMSGEFDGEIVLEEGGYAVICALGAAAAASGHTAGLTAALVPTR